MKKLIGILSIIIFFIIEFDSCAINLVNSFGGVKKVDGTAGMVLGLFMFAAGIISLCSKIYRGRIMASIIFYSIAAAIGYYNIDSYNEIKIWILLNLAFALMILVNLIVKWEKYVFADYTIDLLNNVKKDDIDNLR